MGLDMYAFATKAKPTTEVDFSTKNFDVEEIHYWRKHPNLHGWMQELYDSKGGTSDSFNGDCVVLDNEDLDNLEQDIKDGNLPDTSGFFFGNTQGDEDEDDLLFVKQAREAISNGRTVYYTSWW
ncbi:MAG: hypothetical protein RLZZ196_2693 [Bacteroidota bacterium]|jgi:hypothetical protein